MSRFTLSFLKNTLHIAVSDTAFGTVGGSDFFRLHLDTLENRELEVVSHQQTPDAVEVLGRTVALNDAAVAIIEL